jgi:hypothetical protein
MPGFSLLGRSALVTAAGYLLVAAPLCMLADEAPRARQPAHDRAAETFLIDDLPEPPPAPTRNAHVDDQPVPPSFDAIDSARKGRGSLLEGTLLDKLSRHPSIAAQREFAEALLRIAEDPGANPVRPLPPAEQALPKRLGPSQMSHGSLPMAQGPLIRVVDSQPIEGPGHDILRAAARAMELRAADLEDQRQYPEADRLRTLAQQLRLEARSWEQ